ncbi:MAG: DoxX family protein [Chthoniobacterales bacterium]
MTTNTDTKSPLRHVTTAVRLFVGLAFFVFGLNFFLHFIPQPPDKPMPEFVIAMVKSGYMMPLVGGTQLLVGILLLINRFVPLALALLAPVVVNILALHIFLDPSGIPVAIVVVLLELYLAWSYRSAFAPMLAPKVTPG